MLDVLKPLSNLLHVSDDIYERSFEGVTDELARRPMNGGNRFLWVAAHMVVPRMWLVNRLGVDATVPWEEHFNRGVEPPADGPDWPALADVRAKWREMAALLHQRLDALGPDDLVKPIERYPTTDGTVLGGITLMTFHDAYHIGQLGHLRRRLGLPRLVG